MELGSKKVSETFLLGALLAVSGGFLDAYTYICRGGVFANAQTGNIVLLGIHLLDGSWGKIVYYLIPILAFAVGVFTAEAVRRHFRARRFLHWRQVILAAEMLLLVAAAFFTSERWDMAVNVTVSFICSLQAESFRLLNGNSYATTMCTGNLRSGTELLFRFFVKRDPHDRSSAFQYYGIILFFIAGAAVGALLSHIFAERAVLFSCLPLLAAFGVLFWESKPEEKRKK
jgi:uncharacterized membrane protein YoaK (UPF0700 family)